MLAGGDVRVVVALRGKRQANAKDNESKGSVYSKQYALTGAYILQLRGKRKNELHFCADRETNGWTNRQTDGRTKRFSRKVLVEKGSQLQQQLLLLPANHRLRRDRW